MKKGLIKDLINGYSILKGANILLKIYQKFIWYFNQFLRSSVRLQMVSLRSKSF